MKRSRSRSARRGGRIAVLTSAAVLVLALPLGGAAAAAQASAAQTPTAQPPTAAKPEGPIESSLSVAGTGAMAAAATVLIVRRHQRRSRNNRR
ncbi:hypothetical protein GCM10010387_60450 [Streptomyces inusitatus]|uniref:Gram-positive cocci surface proteins LPxTG domain-containing protein n=1 Tax=Streptomyces inusitatus TaxID=68221 RepID=A0A918V233_9ACTN|nr:hypothetical protein [Streptomyces inusitatus]GGZ58469.1 hypothetical protein GCM10010387_60450 [Streptomyces inusitatus]